MDRNSHLRRAYELIELATELASRGYATDAGESIWGAIVQAVSAADPDHEIQPPDLVGNPHPAPNTRRSYEAAVQRIHNTSMTTTDFTEALQAGQRILHNNFYHLNYSSYQVQAALESAGRYFRGIASHAGQQTDLLRA